MSARSAPTASLNGHHHPFRPAGLSPSALSQSTGPSPRVSPSRIARPATPPPSTLELAGLANAPPSSQKERKGRGKRSRQAGQQQGKKVNDSVGLASATPTSAARIRATQQQQEEPLSQLVLSPLNTVTSTQQSDADFGGAIPASQSTPTQRGKYYADLMSGHQQRSSGSGALLAESSRNTFAPVNKPVSHNAHDLSASTNGKRKRKRKPNSTVTLPHHEAPRSRRDSFASNASRGRPSREDKQSESRPSRADASWKSRSRSRPRSDSRAFSGARSRRASTSRKPRFHDSEDSDADSDSASSASSSREGSDGYFKVDYSEANSRDSDGGNGYSRRSRKRARTQMSLSSDSVATFSLSSDLQFERILDGELRPSLSPAQSAN